MLPWKFTFLLGWVASIICFILANVFFMVIYKLNLPYFEQYKILKSEPWPWVADRKNWDVILVRTLKLVCFNLLVVSPCFVLSLMSLNGYKTKHPVNMEALPSKFTIVWQILFCTLIEDFAFSLSHKFLHRPFFYKHVHKLHHSYLHAVSIAGLYTHPFEFTIGGIIPAGLPTMILGAHMHYYTVVLWIMMRSINTTSSHSGYDFPCFLPWDLLPMRA